MKKRLLMIPMVLVLVLLFGVFANAADSPQFTGGGFYAVSAGRLVNNVRSQIIDEMDLFGVRLEAESPFALQLAASFDAEDEAFAGATCVDITGMELQEVSTLVVEGYKASIGEVHLTLTFPTTFKAGEPVLVMVGLVNGGEVTEWICIEAEVNDEGQITMFVSADIMNKIQEADEAVIVVMQ